MSLEAAVEDDADLVIFDDILPSGFSPFRTIEYSHYLSFFNARLVSTEGWLNWLPNQTFADALDLLPVAPELKQRIVRFSAGEFGGRLAYVTFLMNAVALLPYFEARQLPFILQLYPGGGFRIDQPDADKHLGRVVSSQLCRKVIVTQSLSRDYIIDRIGCDPAKVALIFGGVFESRGDFDFHRDKKIFGRDKSTLDLCFVAHKYGNELISKGFAQFAGIAAALSRENPAVRFHVVGDYSAADVALGDAASQFTFHGRRESAFFRDFYPAMDAIISINQPFALVPGAFDGFPTGACIEAGLHGVLNCINDPLALNPVLIAGEDFLLLDFDQEQSVARLRRLLDRPGELYRLAYANWRKFRAVFATDDQLWARTRLITAELLRPGGVAAPAAESRPDGQGATHDAVCRQLELEHECGRLMAAHRALEGHYFAVEAERKRLMADHRTLEGHYFAVEGERKRLEQYIRSREMAN